MRMTVAQSKKIRLIRVEGIDYFWTAKHNWDSEKLFLRIGLKEQPNYFFTLSLPINSERLFFPNYETNKSFGVVTPSLISEIIKIGNKNLDWKNKKPSVLDNALLDTSIQNLKS
ncbi:MAG: hypothetical protein JXQ87_03140 [Bacteroidia bacterium]